MPSQYSLARQPFGKNGKDPCRYFKRKILGRVAEIKSTSFKKESKEENQEEVENTQH